ncbi:MAG: hypothetical protein GY822_09815 [Deltaproteobacteria bacterium]|nr:hypothetical protein [Deltaproteobacteria bacterium]
MNWIALLGMSAVVLTASFAVAHVALQRQGRVSEWVGALVAMQVAIVVPVYILGTFNRLHKGSVVLGVGIMCAVLFAVAAKHHGGLGQLRSALIQQARSYGSLGGELRTLLRQAGFPVWFGICVAIALWLWLAFGITVSPPRGNSDAFFYHEPIVAFMIQNEGMAVVPLPDNLQRINGMPRFCHFIQYWFALFTGRTLGELPNVLSHLLAVSSLYVLARKLDVTKVEAVGWAFCFSLIPGVLRLTDTIMVDVHAAALFLGAVCLVVVVEMRWVTAVLAACAIALLCGSKLHYLSVAGVLSIILGLRTLAMRGRWSTPRIGATVVVTASIVIAGVCATLLRNYLLFENPMHPFGLHLDALDIHWGKNNGFRSGKDVGIGVVFSKWFAAPFSVKPWLNPSARVEDFGLATAYLSFPIAIAAGVRGAYIAWRHRQRREPLPSSLIAFAAVWVVMMVGITTFPSMVRGRYHLGWMGLTYIVTGWWFAAMVPKAAARLVRRRREIGRAVLLTAQTMMIISVMWTLHHDWVLKPGGVIDRLQVSSAERDYTSRTLMGATKEWGEIRNSRVKPGSTIGFIAGKYFSLWWNDDYSNRIQWLGKGGLERADELKVDWMYMHKSRLETNKDPRAKQWTFRSYVLKGRKGVGSGRMYERTKTFSKSKPMSSDKPKKPQTDAVLKSGVGTQ